MVLPRNTNMVSSFSEEKEWVITIEQDKIRCGWATSNKPFYVNYHDREWGVPVHDDQLHFEMLILEGAQAGLSWETILKRREDYRKAFKSFDPQKVAYMTDEELENLIRDPVLIRNRLKIYSTQKNAITFLKIQEKFGSFDTYVWRFVDSSQQKKRQTLQDIPASTPESVALSKDLKKRGMTFVGPTIIYAYMQAVGIVNDHLVTCFRHSELTI